MKTQQLASPSFSSAKKATGSPQQCSPTKLLSAQAVLCSKEQLEQMAPLWEAHTVCGLPVASFAELNTGLASC